MLRLPLFRMPATVNFPLPPVEFLIHHPLVDVEGIQAGKARTPSDVKPEFVKAGPQLVFLPAVHQNPLPGEFGDAGKSQVFQFHRFKRILWPLNGMVRQDGSSASFKANARYLQEQRSHIEKVRGRGVRISGQQAQIERVEDDYFQFVRPDDGRQFIELGFFAELWQDEAPEDPGVGKINIHRTADVASRVLDGVGTTFAGEEADGRRPFRFEVARNRLPVPSATARAMSRLVFSDFLGPPITAGWP